MPKAQIFLDNKIGAANLFTEELLIVTPNVGSDNLTRESPRYLLKRGEE